MTQARAVGVLIRLTLKHSQVKRARAKQLSPDEYTTGTFTISNL